MLGFPNVDGMDTAMLRAAFARALENPTLMPWSDWVYFPTGFPVLHLMPNWLDHLSAYPLVRGLPFPLADNVWWWLVMAGGGWQ